MLKKPKTRRTYAKHNPLLDKIPFTTTLTYLSCMFDIIVSLQVLSHNVQQSTTEIDEDSAHAEVAHYDAASVQLVRSFG